MTRRRRFLRSLGALLVAATGPLAAQTSETAPTDGAVAPSTDRQTILPANMTPDQLIVFFTMFSASEEMDAAIGPAIDQLMAPGEEVTDWQTRGVDMLAELNALEGGAEAYVLQDTDREVLSVVDLTGLGMPDLDGFDSYALRPDPVGLVTERSFVSFFPGIWFETASQRVQRGSAFCYSGYNGVTLHTARPYTQWSQDELIITASVFAMVDRLANREFCVTYSKKGEGRYASTAFLPDGRELALMNSEETTEVVMKRSGLGAFLRSAPQPASGQ